jgi:hypothetical protein
MSGSLEIGGSDPPGGLMVGSLSYLNSGDMRGVDSVWDAGGDLVTDFSIVSASGTDYTQSFGSSPVPEPASLLMMAAGLVMFRLCRR